MNNIFIIILFLLAGLFVGFVFARFFIWLSNKILGHNTKKEILRKGLSQEELKRRNFYFRNQFYNLSENVEHDLKNYKPWYKRLFKKRMKGGVSQYGSGNDNAGFERKQVPTNSPGIGEQTNTSTPEPNGEQRSINSDLPKEG